MDDIIDVVQVLSEQECWQKLADNTLGRLVVKAADEIDIFPVNYVVTDRTLCIRTAPGTKLIELTIHPDVLFEIDHVDDSAAYSVVVKGTAEELQHQSEIDEADSLPLVPFLPTLKYRWVRIRPVHLSGRAFQRAPEPDRY
ncbi:pyridoxamine 5'-phosphate oxidase family protein [Herbiconiux sp. VKM Ac-1786]|uniref:pyridoxamine 5'-phosphate oxidase family protein n=1 Tax=Herbiconiux sp. VKM Ac-1786 TaxID=2783824 RepID=UPI00188AA45A|nr:pyridoxamine 5'-phosphate oxidase family protein [Herbiconiux sp. VKM Ac-1786]MBF4571952.1 pyridoxamine 5'-phosphate oxidase family protein [Herbiconiux sp. VKM Ac-1786]